TIADEHDAAVLRVGRLDVVAVLGLAGDARDADGLALPQPGDLVHLPVARDPLVLLLGRADHHAEDGLAAVKRHRRIAHRDRVRALHAGRAETGLRGQVAQGA